MIRTVTSLFTYFNNYWLTTKRKPFYRHIRSLKVSFNTSTYDVSSTTKHKHKQNTLSPEQLQRGCRLGTDSHADVTCLGKHARVTEIFHGRSCNVQPFHDSYSPMKNVNTVNASFAHDTEDGKTFIIEVNQALDFTDSMEHSLLCTNQARIHGVIVDDVPKFLDASNRSTHSIQFPVQQVTLPLSLFGPVSYLPVRYPNDEEMDFCQRLELTCGDAPWDPECMNGYQNAISSVQTDQYPTDYDTSCAHPDLYKTLSQQVFVNAITHSPRMGKDLSAENLAKLWHIGLEDARRTLQSTTQEFIRVGTGRLQRRVKTRAHQSRYKQLGGYLGMFASDTFHSRVTSTRGNNYCQLFCNRGNYVEVYPIKLKSHAHHTLDRFLHEVGIPIELLTDGAKELIVADWGNLCRKHRIHQTTTEPHSPWQNPAELCGGIIKRQVRQTMIATNTPVRLWDYCWEYKARIRSRTASNHILLDNTTPFEKVHGYTPNIGEFISFDWYQWIWYHEPTSPDKSLLGRWLGPAHTSGQGMAYYILTKTGKIVTRSTVNKLSMDEDSSNEMERRKSDFTDAIELVIGNYCTATISKQHSDYDPNKPYDSLFDDDELDDENIAFQELDHNNKPIAKPNVDEFLPTDAPIMELTDEHIGMRVTLPHQGEMVEGIVKSRKRNSDGTLIGTSNANPIMDTRSYSVEFGDGTYGDYSTNVLIENLYSHIDDEGRSHALLKSIVNHRKDNTAVPKTEGFYTTTSGASKRKITTKGWEIQVTWDDGTSSWVPLSDIKESNPIELAEYAISRQIHDEPAFSWWVNHTLRKRNRLIKLVQHRVVKKSLKFGVQVPSSVKEALALDKENGNTLWSDAINKELKNVLVAFQLLEDGETLPVGSKRIPYHIIFDVKFNLTRKARCVAGGHRNDSVPTHATYSSVASRDSIRLGLMIAALNDINVLAADIGNAYLNAPCREKVHVKVGPELFGAEHEGKFAVIVRALYGLKSAGNSWRNHFATCIREDLGYAPTVADPDVYLKPETKPDGTKYYSYLIVYVDDILCIHDQPKRIMDKIGSLFNLKNTVEEPKLYLGADIRKWDHQTSDGTTNSCWAIGSESYVREAVKVAEAQMAKHNLSFTSSKRHGRNTPFSDCQYRPELDASDLCNPELSSVYQNLIGVLRWTCELGRIDILHETSILSQYLAAPRIGHLTQSLNIFYYLKHHDRSWMVLDPTRFDVDWTPRNNEESPQTRAHAMKDIYPDACDELPHNMPVPRGKPVDLNVFVDADHAGNKVTRRSHTGIIIYCNLAPILWYSKKQNTIETSTFGSEYIALRIATELIDGLRYKLRMFGIPIEGPARVFCDNEAVVKSSSFPESALKKKHCSIAYNKVRESVAAGKLLMYYESTQSNLADLLTKVLSHVKRHGLVQAILS
jgi:hypothetical protein